MLKKADVSNACCALCESTIYCSELELRALAGGTVEALRAAKTDGEASLVVSLLTIDTEPSLRAQHFGVAGLENIESSIYGRTPKGEYGIAYQIERLNAHRLKGVFFVEALHTRVLGVDHLKRMVDTILSGGHEVQLHLHVEWVWWASPPNPRSIRGMKQLSLADQESLIRYGADALERCGAPRPIAFRAGAFEANDTTPAAAAKAGLRFDSSYNHCRVPGQCAMTPRRNPNQPFPIGGIMETPLTCFHDYPGHVRHAQLCSISTGELRHLLRRHSLVNILSHSFELLNRARTAPNPLLLRRFDAFCDVLASKSQSCFFRDLEAAASSVPEPTARLSSSNLFRTAARLGEQAISHAFFDGPEFSVQ